MFCHLNLGAGFVTGFDDKITSSNRFALGGDFLRGFASSGIGPRDTGNDECGRRK